MTISAHLFNAQQLTFGYVPVSRSPSACLPKAGIGFGRHAQEQRDRVFPTIQTRREMLWQSRSCEDMPSLSQIKDRKVGEVLNT